MNWNSSSAPLRVFGYGSNGWGFGDWTVSTGGDGTRSRLMAQQRIDNADNHTVFVTFETWVNAGFCFAPQYTNCSQPYYFFESGSTSRVNSSSWRQRWATTGVSPAADKARAYVRVKLDVPWRMDPSSNPTITNGRTY